MAAQEDQSAWLPEPPPPRPARRDEAISAALRKFDGDEQTASAHERPRRSWASAHRPQVAAFASAMLLVIVGIPAAYIGLQNAPPKRELPAVPRQKAPATAVQPAVDSAAGRTANAPEALAPVQVAPPTVSKDQKESTAVAARTEAVSQDVPVQEAPAPAVAAAAPPPAAPPPPPPAPQAEASGVVSSDEIVLTGSRVAGPLQERPNGFEAKAQRSANRADASSARPRPAYAAFLSRLQSASRRDDRRAIIGMVRFPLRVNAAGGARIYRDARSLDRDFDRVFTAKVRRAIAGQRANQLFVRDQGAMIGSGEIWFDQTCLDTASSRTGPVRIIAVNP